MYVRRIISAVCALTFGLHLAPVADAAEPQPVLSEDAADFPPTLEPDNSIPRPKTYALARSNGTLYAGGAFHLVKDAAGNIVTRHNFMAFDESTGELLSSPAVNGTVRALAVRGSALYIGGAFNSVAGTPQRGLAKVDLTTGTVDPLFDAHLGKGVVNAVQWVSGRLLVGGTFSRRLIAVDPVTGQDTRYLRVGVRGTVSSSDAVATGIYDFSLNAHKTGLVAVGNFAEVGGQVRRRAFALRLGADRAVLDDWYYGPLNRSCKSRDPRRSPYLTDVDFAPRGGWFVLVSTGWVPKFESQIGTSVCDAAARFEFGIKKPTVPTWINYTGGDTLHSVDVTPAAVYVQGHNRWLDNPYGVDSPGPGSVQRRGIGAIDSVTGKALSWNPDKPAQQGGRAFLWSGTGLWVGSDSVTVGGEYHRGLAFFPLPAT